MGSWLAEFQTLRTFTVRYAGLHDIRLDGAIQQVGWEIGRGTFTTASRNSEFDRAIPSYKRRKEVEEIRRFLTAGETTGRITKG